MIATPVKIADIEKPVEYDDWYFIVDANGEMVARCSKKETADIIVDSINKNGA